MNREVKELEKLEQEFLEWFGCSSNKEIFGTDLVRDFLYWLTNNVDLREKSELVKLIEDKCNNDYSYTIMKSGNQEFLRFLKGHVKS